MSTERSSPETLAASALSDMSAQQLSPEVQAASTLFEICTGQVGSASSTAAGKDTQSSESSKHLAGTKAPGMQRIESDIGMIASSTLPASAMLEKSTVTATKITPPPTDEETADTEDEDLDEEPTGAGLEWALESRWAQPQLPTKLNERRLCFDYPYLAKAFHRFPEQWLKGEFGLERFDKLIDDAGTIKQIAQDAADIERIKKEHSRLAKPSRLAARLENFILQATIIQKHNEDLVSNRYDWGRFCNHHIILHVRDSTMGWPFNEEILFDEMWRRARHCVDYRIPGSRPADGHTAATYRSSTVNIQWFVARRLAWRGRLYKVISNTQATWKCIEKEYWNMFKEESPIRRMPFFDHRIRIRPFVSQPAGSKSKSKALKDSKPPKAVQPEAPATSRPSRPHPAARPDPPATRQRSFRSHKLSDQAQESMVAEAEVQTAGADNASTPSAQEKTLAPADSESPTAQGTDSHPSSGQSTPKKSPVSIKLIVKAPTGAVGNAASAVDLSVKRKRDASEPRAPSKRQKKPTTSSPDRKEVSKQRKSNNPRKAFDVNTTTSSFPERFGRVVGGVLAAREAALNHDLKVDDIPEGKACCPSIDHAKEAAFVANRMKGDWTAYTTMKYRFFFGVACLTEQNLRLAARSRDMINLNRTQAQRYGRMDVNRISMIFGFWESEGLLPAMNVGGKAKGEQVVNEYYVRMCPERVRREVWKLCMAWEDREVTNVANRALERA